MDGQRTKCFKEQIFSNHDKESEEKKDLIKRITQSIRLLPQVMRNLF